MSLKADRVLSTGPEYVNYIDVGEPSTYEEVMAAPNVDTWLQATKSEMD